MEQSKNSHSPESPCDSLADFEPVLLRYRADGWTPAKQREFVEALADCGIIRQAAAMVGMSEQSVSRLRRRPEARAFDIACDAAQRIGSRRLLSVAFERVVEGTIKRHYYHGELKSEERVYDNKLLTYLLGKLGPMLEPRAESSQVEADWSRWMDAIETGASPPQPEAREPAGAREESEFDGSEVWQMSDGSWWTSFPPPPDFDGEEGRNAIGSYQRTLTEEELAVIEADEAGELREDEARRDRFFGFAPKEDFFSYEAEPSTPSAREQADEDGFAQRCGGAEEPAQ